MYSGQGSQESAKQCRKSKEDFRRVPPPANPSQNHTTSASAHDDQVHPAAQAGVRYFDGSVAALQSATLSNVQKALPQRRHDRPLGNAEDIFSKTVVNAKKQYLIGLGAMTCERFDHRSFDAAWKSARILNKGSDRELHPAAEFSDSVGECRWQRLSGARFLLTWLCELFTNYTRGNKNGRNMSMSSKQMSKYQPIARRET